jgi:hypothetical protein
VCLYMKTLQTPQHYHKLLPSARTPAHKYAAADKEAGESVGARDEDSADKGPDPGTTKGITIQYSQAS